jgi:hypothetical protein
MYNPEAMAFVKLYGVDLSTDIEALEKKVVSYCTLHFFQVRKWISTADNDWNSGKYE